MIALDTVVPASIHGAIAYVQAELPAFGDDPVHQAATDGAGRPRGGREERLAALPTPISLLG